jgi:hypothetical protein
VLFTWTTHGCKDYAIGNFVKFGGGNVMHHNCTMLEEYIYVAITFCVLAGVHLPYLEHDHGPPFHTIDSVVGYIILWPWKLTTKL